MYDLPLIAGNVTSKY